MDIRSWKSVFVGEKQTSRWWGGGRDVQGLGESAVYCQCGDGRADYYRACHDGMPMCGEVHHAKTFIDLEDAIEKIFLPSFDTS